MIVTGVALKVHLRELCGAQGLVAGKSSIDGYNAALKAAGVYPKRTWRQVQVDDLRNDAAHGRRLERLARSEAEALPSTRTLT